jgi:hypothetical protein
MAQPQAGVYVGLALAIYAAAVEVWRALNSWRMRGAVVVPAARRHSLTVAVRGSKPAKQPPAWGRGQHWLHVRRMACAIPI